MLNCLRFSGVVALLVAGVNCLFAQSPADVALQYFQQQPEKLGLLPEDVASLAITDQHHSTVSGLSHVYLQQYVDGFPVEQGRASVHISPTGEVAFATDGLIRNAQQKSNRSNPVLTAEQALEAASNFLELQIPAVKTKTLQGQILQLTCEKTANGAPLTIPASLRYELDGQQNLRLCWHLVVPDGENTWAISIDAEIGVELARHNWLQQCHSGENTTFEKQETTHSHLNQGLKALREGQGAVPTAELPPASPFDEKYWIFARPFESPLSGNRTLELGDDLIDMTASPYGWHDTGTPGSDPEFGYTRGNNVYAYYAPLGTPTTPTATPIERELGLYTSGNVPWPDVELEFNYNHDLNSPVGTTFIEDAVTNLFAWNNICHDVFFHYGFDEAAGNFQATNLTGNGLGGDYVRARAQDGSGVNNAGFFTPPEPPMSGQNPPFMRMFLWDTDFPDRLIDGDFDNAIITHEYGHGVSIRLVGGPATNACLTNFEQGGEGWSDFFGLLFTLRDADGDGTLEENVLGEGIRSIGPYVLNEAENGEGIRPAYYSTNMDCTTNYCNDFTYGDVPNMVQPHGTGFVWCSMLWEMTWELIDLYGFEPNIYNTSSTAGNIRAMKIVVEGLKLTACNPTFPQMRDAILVANQNIYDGEGGDQIWAAFARRGLGYSATSPGNESFDDPTMLVTKTVDKVTAEQDETVTYTITVKNNTGATLNSVNITDMVDANLDMVTVSDGGDFSGGMVSWMGLSIAEGGTISRTFSGNVAASGWTMVEAEYPVEDPVSTDFAPAGTWISTTDNFHPSSGSTRSWWHLDPPTISDASLVLNLDLDGSKNNHLSFWHFFDLEPTLDGGVVEVLVGSEWVDLGPNFIKNNYNSYLVAQLITPIGVPIDVNPLNGRRGFSGYSGGWVQSIIDLSDYDGATQLRFRFGSDQGTDTGDCDGTSPGCDGWFIDDLEVLDLKHLLNTANVAAAPSYAGSGNVGRLGTIIFEGAPLPVELVCFNARPVGQDIQLHWTTASERNNAGFEVQRRSELEAAFAPLGWVGGAGNSSQIIDYQFFDKNVEPNLTYYYRLRQMDYDGREQFSEVASAMVPGTGQGIQIFPNPAPRGDFFLQMEKVAAGDLEVKISNLAGQRLFRFALPAGQLRYPLDLLGLVPGAYLVTVKLGDDIFHEKLLVE